MTSRLHILHLEDSRADAELVRAALVREGLDAEWVRVASENAYVAALDKGGLSLILSDYKLPGFDGMAALRIAREKAPDIPFIFVSGQLPEDTAIEALRSGATDYVFKNRLTRLGPVVRRALEEAQALAQRRQYEQVRSHLAAIVESSDDAICSHAPDGTVLSWNASAERMFGYSAAEMIGQNISVIEPPDFAHESRRHTEALLRGEPTPTFETVRLAKDGHPVRVQISVSPIRGEARNVVAVAAIIRDITGRLRMEQALRDYTEQLRRLSRQLFEVQEAERRRVARELHDRVGQNVTALNLNLNMIRAELPPDSLQKIGARLDDCETLLYSTGQLVRDVMADLRPPGLDQLGLVAALTEHARQVAARSGLSVTVSGTEPAPRLPPETEITLFRIAQEALMNVAKHARATEVAVILEADPDKVIMTVSDNGCGFDAAAHLSRASTSLGMVSMRERVEATGGRLRVESAPGRGTRVMAEAPRATPTPWPRRSPGSDPAIT